MIDVDDYLQGSGGTMKYSSHLALVKTQLGPTQFDVLHSEMYRLSRNTITAYILWAFLGWAGVHQFYLGKRWKGLMYLFSVLLGVGALAGSFWLPVRLEEPYNLALRSVVVLGEAIFLFWWVMDLFSLHRQVDLCNERIEDQIIMALVGHSTAARPEARRQARPLYFE
jgi:hypothetical protein